MSTLRTLTAAAALLAAMGAASAKSDMKLVITPTDGAPVEVAAADVTSLKFGQQHLTLVGSPTMQWAIKQVTSIKFLTANSGIEAAEALTDMRLAVSADMVRAEGAGSATGTVYNLAGMAVASGNASEGIAIAHLPKGAYLLNVNNKTFKFVK